MIKKYVKVIQLAGPVSTWTTYIMILAIDTPEIAS
jgi:hypothetical protein